MSAAHWVEAVLAAAPVLGVLLLCWHDPAGHYAAEVRRRQAERDIQQG